MKRVSILRFYDVRTTHSADTRLVKRLTLLLSNNRSDLLTLFRLRRFLIHHIGNDGLRLVGTTHHLLTMTASGESNDTLNRRLRHVNRNLLQRIGNLKSMSIRIVVLSCVHGNGRC